MPVSMIVEQSSTLKRCVIEVAHHVLELALGHLAVRDARCAPRAGARASSLARSLDRVDVVVQEVDLAAALELAQHRLADRAGRHSRDEGLDREPPLRRRSR